MAASVGSSRLAMPASAGSPSASATSFSAQQSAAGLRLLHRLLELLDDFVTELERELGGKPSSRRRSAPAEDRA